MSMSLEVKTIAAVFTALGEASKSFPIRLVIAFEARISRFAKKVPKRSATLIVMSYDLPPKYLLPSTPTAPTTGAKTEGIPIKAVAAKPLATPPRISLPVSLSPSISRVRSGPVISSRIFE